MAPSSIHEKPVVEEKAHAEHVEASPGAQEAPTKATACVLLLPVVVLDLLFLLSVDSTTNTQSEWRFRKRTTSVSCARLISIFSLCAFLVNSEELCANNAVSECRFLLGYVSVPLLYSQKLSKHGSSGLLASDVRPICFRGYHMAIADFV